jgi:hypothetical protein
MTDDLLKPETKEEYQRNESEYFRNVGAPKGAGRSAIDPREVASRLPPQEEKLKLLDRFERGFDKTSRSGAFSKAGAGPAIFPNGRKFAMDFIDEMTPKRAKPEEAKRPITEQTRPVDAPKAAAVIDGICIDCMKPIDLQPGAKIVPWMKFCTAICPVSGQPDFLKLFSMGIKFGDPVLGFEHFDCWDKAQKEGRNATPLALVQGGSLTSMEDIAIAVKYGFPVNLHDGQERTMGQWNMVKRQARIDKNLEDYMIALDKTSPIYAKNRKEV